MVATDHLGPIADYFLQGTAFCAQSSLRKVCYEVGTVSLFKELSFVSNL